ncbi:MAG: ATP-binding protein, partial [Bacteroidota bacterium]
DILIRENKANADSADQLFEDMLSYAEFCLAGIDIEKGNLPEAKTNRMIPVVIRKNYFFIFKECLNNIKKHAGCSRVILSWGIKENNLFLEIEDNGKGFDTSKNYIGNGLKNFNDRAEKISGKFQIVSSPGNGTKTTLCAILPDQVIAGSDEEH